MDFKKSAAVALAVTMGVIATSCHKDKDSTTTSNSFSGTLSVKGLPTFVLKGDTHQITPTGLENEGVDIGYYFTASPLYTSKDTTRFLGDPESNDGSYAFFVKDTLCTVTVTCTAFASGYYTSSYSGYCTIVDPAIGGSITNNDIDDATPIFTDERDSQDYYYRTIGSLDWFVKNLQYAEAGQAFYDCTAMDGVYGRFYTWTEAQTACPDGWRLPSKEDWLALAKEAGYTGEAAEVYSGVAGNLMADAYFNTEKMWEYWPAVKITNSTGFSAIPTGYGIAGSRNLFYNDFNDAVWWSSESATSEESGEELGVNMMINVNKPELFSNRVSKDSFIAPVRCVRDSE